MAIDLTKKLVPAIGYVRVKNADGSMMIEDDGTPAYARMHSPASKIWQVADASRHRKMMARVREQGGKIEAATDQPEDIEEFLNTITEEFYNVDVPVPEGESGAKALVRAIYANQELGYIRDGMYRESKDWGSFLASAPTSSKSTLGSSPGSTPHPTHSPSETAPSASQ